ncbi:hypothetical protein [Calothrix sp. 336/3]|uniref:hypothetical protein n=1 Tax=Calothrix sp. 336/3 TaxID=1337936 RepID=UPI00143C8A65|nr:hypothetical protein [Calothrix sp. 336/3]
MTVESTVTGINCDRYTVAIINLSLSWSRDLTAKIFPYLRIYSLYYLAKLPLVPG